MAPLGRPEEVKKRNAFGKARLAQSVERLALNQVVVGSSPTVGDHFLFLSKLRSLCACGGAYSFLLLLLTLGYTKQLDR